MARPRYLIVDGDYAPLVKQALALVDREIIVIDIEVPGSIGRADRDA